MSEIDWTSGDRGERRESRTGEMARALSRGGMEGAHVLSLESAEEVLTPKRRELIELLRAEEVDSVRELARCVERDKGQVSRDLGVLAEHGIIKYEESGRSKRPYIVQDHIVVEPL